MKKKVFKSESKELLNLMIHSIYSNKDIFLRELISNASDALDKREFLKIQGLVKANEAAKIDIKIDKENRIITISDNGIGMDDVELDENLGTIAHSGSKAFLSELEDDKKLDIIGQFGVGFYSSFIVADQVEVITRKEAGVGYKWISDGVESYSVGKIDTDIVGTQISLIIKEGHEFDDYLDNSHVKRLIKEHSDFVKFPIMMEKVVKKDEEEVIETEVVNSQVAIWKKDKRSIKKNEYNEFYTNKFHDFNPPQHVIHAKSEGVMNQDLLLFIPSKKPFDFYTQNYKKGLSLYSKGILIDESVDYLIPDHFGFVKGLVDSEDLSLNVSREMLQIDSSVEKIKKAINTKIKKELEKMLNKKREEYNKFYTEFGRTLMYGVYDGFGVNAKDLENLIMFKSSLDGEYVTLKEYVERNKEQEFIYYVAGDSIERINNMPITKQVLAKGIEVLYLTDDIDEFAIQILQKYDDVEFKSINLADFTTDEEKEELEKIENDYKEVIKKIKSALTDYVIDVKLTTKIGDVASSLINDNGISIEQEKLLMQMPDSNFHANKILELNPTHELFNKVTKATDVEDYAKILFYQAQLLEGLEIKDPLEFINLTNKLIK